MLHPSILPVGKMHVPLHPLCIYPRQSTEAESKLADIYSLLNINSKPFGKRKSMLHPNRTSKNPDIGNQGVT